MIKGKIYSCYFVIIYYFLKLFYNNQNFTLIQVSYSKKKKNNKINCF